MGTSGFVGKPQPRIDPHAYTQVELSALGVVGHGAHCLARDTPAPHVLLVVVQDLLAGVELAVSRGEPLATSASAQVSSLLDSEQLPFVRHAPQGM